MPNEARVTIRQILIWIAANGSPVVPANIADRFGTTQADGDCRLRKLHRWGYLRRSKRKLKGGEWPRFVYWPTAFGKRTARKWSRE